MHFSHLNSFNSHSNPMKEKGTVVITILQTRKLRHREIERLAQGAIDSKLLGRDANISTAALKSLLSTTLFSGLSKSSLGASPGELMERYLGGSLDIPVTPSSQPFGDFLE